MAVSPRRLLAGITASVLVLDLALTLSALGAADATSAGGPSLTPQRLPRPFDRYEQAASACPGLDPLLLVAIHDVESSRDAHGQTSAAGAVGPMQFMPDTWAVYGVDANQDGTADPHDLGDALSGAARMLCANGVTQHSTYATAIWNYNHSWTYVQTVLERVAELHRTVGA